MFSRSTAQRRTPAHPSRHLHTRFLAASLIGASLATLSAGSLAAASQACQGGGFTVLGRSGEVKVDVPASRLGTSFSVVGKYVRFEIDSATFGVRNYTLTGAANPLDMTGGVATPVFASKLPDHKGLVLSGPAELELKDSDLVIRRKGRVDMKIQAKDCAQGGIFQMEVERDDNATTLFTHTLATSATNANLTPFYFDNRNFREREGDLLPYGDVFMAVPARVNFGNDFSPAFVGRDSPQLATRRSEPTCANTILNRFGLPVTVSHCGAVSRWDVKSGGRMGMVFGEDAVEVAPSATECNKDCQARSRVRGKAVVLGSPFPVAPADRLQPRLP